MRPRGAADVCLVMCLLLLCTDWSKLCTDWTEMAHDRNPVKHLLGW